MNFSYFLFLSVHRYDRAAKRPFSLACSKVVLANGGSDLVNRLGVKGENKSLAWLKYELPLLENAIEDMKDVKERTKIKPVLIVGAGLSAADAIVACRNAGIQVIHVYRGVAAGFVSTLYYFEFVQIFTHRVDVNKYLIPRKLLAKIIFKIQLILSLIS
jgi:hypothetical protein